MAVYFLARFMVASLRPGRIRTGQGEWRTICLAMLPIFEGGVRDSPRVDTTITSAAFRPPRAKSVSVHFRSNRRLPLQVYRKCFRASALNRCLA